MFQQYKYDVRYFCRKTHPPTKTLKPCVFSKICDVAACGAVLHRRTVLCLGRRVVARPPNIGHVVLRCRYLIFSTTTQPWYYLGFVEILICKLCDSSVSGTTMYRLPRCLVNCVYRELHQGEPADTLYANGRDAATGMSTRTYVRVHAINTLTHIYTRRSEKKKYWITGIVASNGVVTYLAACFAPAETVTLGHGDHVCPP